jgi:hypothetical protein
MIRAAPWDPQELFPTVTALNAAVIAPFVTRPNEKSSTEGLGLAPATASTTGVYLSASGGKAAASFFQEQGTLLGRALRFSRKRDRSTYTM